MAPDDSAEIETVLKVGDLVKLRIDVGQSRRAYDGWVAGLGEGRVTVNVPEASPLLLIGPSDFRVVMRKETDYALYRIEALARPRVGTRAPQLDLMPQGEIQRVQRRWNVRLKVLIDLRETVLIEGEQEKPFKSTILDLSAGGVLIHTREPLLVGATVGLDFALPGSPDPAGDPRQGGLGGQDRLGGLGVFPRRGNLREARQTAGERDHPLRLPGAAAKAKDGASPMTSNSPRPVEGSMVTQPIGTAKGPGEKPQEYTFLTPDRDNAVKVGEFVFYSTRVDGAERQVIGRVVQRRPARLYPDEFSSNPLVPPASVASALGYTSADAELFEVTVSLLGYFDEPLRSFVNPRIPPRQGWPIYLVPDEALTRVLNPRTLGSAGSAHVGYLLSRPGRRVPVVLSAKELVATHMAIIASTGAGKSYLAGVVIEELMKPGNRACLLIVDPHGEYHTLDGHGRYPRLRRPRRLQARGEDNHPRPGVREGGQPHPGRPALPPLGHGRADGLHPLHRPPPRHPGVPAAPRHPRALDNRRPQERRAGLL